MESKTLAAVDGLVHQLAKDGARSKIRTMYGILPRKTIVSLLKLHVGRNAVSHLLNLLFFFRAFVDISSYMNSLRSPAGICRCAPRR